MKCLEHNSYDILYSLLCFYFFNIFSPNRSGIHSNSQCSLLSHSSTLHFNGCLCHEKVCIQDITILHVSYIGVSDDSIHPYKRPELRIVAKEIQFSVPEMHC